MTSNARNSRRDSSRSSIGETSSRKEHSKPVTSEQEEKGRLWLAEHADAIRAENEYIERHGLPLAKHRLF